MKELLKNIGITESGHFEKNGDYVIEFNTDAQYNKAFSKLDRSDLVEENPSSGAITTSTSIVVYDSDEYALQLLADFDNNIYKLIVKEVEN